MLLGRSDWGAPLRACDQQDYKAEFTWRKIKSSARFDRI